MSAPRLTRAALEAARVLYDFHFLRRTAQPADVIVALGTNDLRVAAHAAELYGQGFAPWLLCTGGVAHQGDLLETAWPQAEALMYRDAAVAAGVPAERILLETEATNTAENFRFTRRVLAEAGLAAASIVVAVKPFMQRRAEATIRVHWPEIAYSLSSPALEFTEYCTPELPPEKIIHILMGDLQRLWVYAEKGWSAPQETPAAVREAFRFLEGEGWTRHLIAV